MTERYLVQISQSQITPTIVVANSQQAAIERALRGEGDPGEPWQEKPCSKRVVKEG
jgi:hypothetical protein